jgi:hypothetical protein
VITRLFIRSFVKAPDKILEDITHLDIGDFRWMKVDLAEFRDNEEESIGLIKLRDMLLEPEVVYDVASAAGKPFYKVSQIRGAVIGSPLSFSNVYRLVL